MMCCAVVMVVSSSLRWRRHLFIGVK
jgi:hypothetical protein